MTYTNSSSGAIAAHNQTGPLLTVLVATRDSEAHIRECVHGLMEQSLADRMEVIVVDQGSRQSEWAVVSDLQRRHDNLISLRLPASFRGAAALDLALRMASGRYISVVEASDRMRQDAYELLTAALERDSSAMAVYGDTCYTTVPHQSFANHTSHGTRVWPEYRAQDVLGYGEVAPHPVWRREVHETVGPIGSPDGFLARVAQRFPVLHVNQYTGLKLVAADPAPEAKAEPTAEEAFAKLGAAISGSDPQQVVQALEQHLRRYPEHALAHNNLAAVSYQAGEKEKSLRHYRMAVQLAPAEDTYQKNLADLLYVEGSVDEAIGIYLELLKRSPRDVEILLNLGIICEGVGQPAEADTFYQRALEIEPSNQAVREQLTELRHREAAAREPRTAAPGHEPVEQRYQRAQDLVEKGDLDGAAQELQAILAAHPDFAPAHNDLAVLSYQRGFKDEALAHYEQAAALAPGNSTFQKNLADFYFVEGHNIDGAIAIYLEQLRKEPRDVETLMNLGKICVLLDRPQEAESFYGKVTQLEPWNMAAQQCLSNLRQCVNA